MDITKMLAELRAERELIEQVIVVLERLTQGNRKRLGRPPKWISTIHGEEASQDEKSKPFVSAASRKRMSEAQKKRWQSKKQAMSA